MHYNGMKRFFSLLLIVCFILTMAPITLQANEINSASMKNEIQIPEMDEADNEEEGEEPAVSVPAADALAHEHHSAGWSCEQIKKLICAKEEHTHSVEEGCYTQHGEDDPICGKAVGEGAHQHTDDCKEIATELICNEVVEDEGHIHQDTCYDTEDETQLICGYHVHDEACYTTTENLICGQDENEGHMHDAFNCYYELTCDKEAHTHNPNTEEEDTCYELEWICHNEFKLLTVEYRLIVDNTVIPIAETYQALLPMEYVYSLEGEFLPDLTGEGYVLKQAVKYTASVPAGDNTQTGLINESKKLTGTIKEDTKWILSYGYQEELAPYKAYYWGHSAKGTEEILLYAFEGCGPKDISIMVPDNINTMMDHILEAMDSDEIKPLGDGEKMIDALIEKTDELNRVKADPDEPEKGERLLHDITPFLQAIAKKSLGDEKLYRSLTRRQIKQYIADNREKVYGLDLERNEPADAALLVTSDEKAEKNLFYVAGDTYTVKFETGITGAEVWGLTKFKSEDERPVITPPQPDDDGVVIEYAKNITENSISTLAEVDISDYTKNIYATAKAGGYQFIGWWWGEDAHAITDYTADKAAGQYKFLKEEGRIIEPDELQYIDAVTGELTGLTNMPSGGRTYYGIWQPSDSEYVVQVWFESEDGKFYYHDHTLDTIARNFNIGEEVRYNEFDVERAAEKRVVDAANGASGAAFPVLFSDPSSKTTDRYYSYGDYMKSPFYGFDFHACANDTGTGGGDKTCIHSLPHKNKVVKADGTVEYEDCVTEGNLCNCESVTLNPSVSKVLNVYYTREMWEIEMHSGVWMYAFKENNMIGGRALDIIRQEARICHEAPDIGLFTLKTESYPEIGATVVPKNTDWKDYGLVDGSGYPLSEFIITVTGRYGTQVPAGYEGTGEKWKTVDYEFGGFQSTISIIGYDDWTTHEFYEALLASSDDKGHLYTQDGQAVTSEKKLDFKGFTTVDPYLFTNTSSGYIMTSAKIWKGNRFSAESAYDVGTNTYTYGTHKLEIFPYFSDTENTFDVDFYLQTMPGGTADKTDAQGIGYQKMDADGQAHNMSITAPYDMLSVSIDVPEGYTALKWTDELQTRAAASFNTKTVISAASKATVKTRPNQQTVPAAYVNLGNSGYATYNARHNGGFSKVALTGHNIYESDWKIWEAASRGGIVGYLTPMNYWITDWVRATDAEGKEYPAKTNGTVASVDKLAEDSDQGDVGSRLLLDQLRSNVRVGYIHPTGMLFAALGNNGNAYRLANGTYRATGNASVLFARNKYRINYHTCFLNKDGKLLTDQNGNVKYVDLYSTPREVWYEQKLGEAAEALDLTAAASQAAEAENNYYNAYFAYDAVKESTITMTDSEGSQLGPVVYTNDTAKKIYQLINPEDEAEKAQYENTSLIGGYGQWYLDPDGTIPFNEDNLAQMPAGDIDVYYHYSDFKYKVVFVDVVNKTQNDTTEINRNDTPETITHVQEVQSVVANGKPVVIEHLENDAYVFAGWYQEPEGIHLYDFGKEITEDTPIYAIWRPKVPTTYEIRHVLVDKNGQEIDTIQVEKGNGYVDDTIHGRALQNVYSDGLYYVADDYSRSMVLVENPDEHTQNNVLIYQYRQPTREYVVEYRDINNPDHKLLPDKTVQTNYRQVTEKYVEIDGWEYVGNTTYLRDDLWDDLYATIQLIDGEVGVITFWYQQNMNAISVNIPVEKLLDGKHPAGTAFSFELKNEAGEVIATASSVEGVVSFPAFSYDTVGTHTYTISEINEGEEDIIYDEAIFTVIVDVRIVIDPNRNPNRYLNPVITYLKDGAAFEGTPVFENHTNQPEPPAPDTPDDQKPDEPKQNDPNETQPGQEAGLPTGDHTSFGGYILLMLGSLAVLIVLVHCRKKKQAE